MIRYIRVILMITDMRILLDKMILMLMILILMIYMILMRLHDEETVRCSLQPICNVDDGHTNDNDDDTGDYYADDYDGIVDLIS